ncbi:hypothetical protein Tco_1482209 [Tanacetum coccineum]
MTVWILSSGKARVPESKKEKRVSLALGVIPGPSSGVRAAMLRVDTVLQIPRWRSPHEGLLLTISLKRCPSLLGLSVLSFPWLLRMCPSGHVMFLSDDVPVRTYTRTGEAVAAG